MTIPMDGNLENSCGERARRLYNKNAELENRRRKAAQARLPTDPNTWLQMRENYEAIILNDHAFSEQHEVEYALWQLHYKRIEELRAHYSASLASASLDGKGLTRVGADRISKIRSQFKTFLSEATGFYHDLMVKIRAKYGLPLDYFSNHSGNEKSLSKDGNKSVELKKGLLSCNRCLIYLGDLARYKGLYGESDSKPRDFAAASSYYMQASSLWPSSGNPHHQLAILDSYLGDDLAAVYRYFRSLAVESPFSTASENLMVAFEKNRHSYSQLLSDVEASSVKAKHVLATGRGRGKAESMLPVKYSKVETSTVEEKPCNVPGTLKAFSIRFVRLNGIFFTRTSLETFEEVFSLTRSDFLELVPSGPNEEMNFGSDASECRLMVIRFVAILIFTVDNVNRETENKSYTENLRRSVVLNNAFTATFEFMGYILESCIQLNDVSASYFLPGVMIFLEWLACHQDIAVDSDTGERQASARSFFWNHCILFFNKLLSSEFIPVNQNEDDICFHNMSRYDEGETANRLALPEDFELRGFLPLLPAQYILDFSRKYSFESDGGIKEKKARVERIIAAGKALANVVKIGHQGIYFDTNSKRFVVGVEPQTFGDYSLCSPTENATLNLEWQGNSVGSETSAIDLQPKLKLYVERDDEDEVIVFKPSLTEKHANIISSKLTSSEVTSISDVSKVKLGNFAPDATSHDGFNLQNSFCANSRLPTPQAEISAGHYLQSIQTSSLDWPQERESVANQLANLSLLENGFPTRFEWQDYSKVLQPAASTVPFPRSISLAVNRYPVQVAENIIPPRLDHTASSGASADIVSIKPPSAISVGLKKNPVSRPIRHFAPPPGFNSVPPKPVHESLSGTMISEAQAVNDYSWLNVYQLSPSGQGGIKDSVNHSTQAYGGSSKSSNSMSFEQQQLLQKVNHQSVALGHQYQG